jgi:medium-chain acyl-[acyl-carrier-protein] hydrolase
MNSTTVVNSWLTRFQANPGAKLRLFCFPYAGGGANIFRNWPDRLPTWVEVWSIELPGRGARYKEAPFMQMSSLIQEIASVILPYLYKPFAFFGHSMGAIVGFELARHLFRQFHRSPEHLFVSGRRAPQIPDQNPPIHLLPEPAFMDELRRLNGTPEEILQDAELMRLFLPALRADFKISETYRYTKTEPLACPISAFGGSLDTEVSAENLAAWNEHTRSFFKIRMFPGDHFFLNSARPLVTQAVSQDLSLHRDQVARDL